MDHDYSNLSDDQQKRQKQHSAISALQEAFKQCQDAEIVIVGYEGVLIAFDQDKLFATGWSPATNGQELPSLGYPIDTNDAFITCFAPSPHP